MNRTMQPAALCGLVVSLLLCLAPAADAQSATPSRITGWKVSCGVDGGALTRTGDAYVFRPSSNRCDGHTAWGWDQRTEIFSRDYSPNLRGRYVFESTVSLRSGSRQRFDIFQIHDGRQACAPPLKVAWTEDNGIALRSHYKVAGRGEEHCINNDITTRRHLGAGVLRRDGTAYLLQIILDFDGAGGFTVLVAVDGRRVIEGRYGPDLPAGTYTSVSGIRMDTPPIDRSRKFSFKHGVYAEDRFDFELVSRGMRMVRIR